MSETNQTNIDVSKVQKMHTNKKEIVFTLNTKD